MPERRVFPRSYVNKATKRLHPKYWIAQDGQFKRRFLDVSKTMPASRALFAHTPHLVRVGLLGTSFDEKCEGSTTWEEAMDWMAENATEPWYFSQLPKRGDQIAGSYIGFANRNDAVHFALWYRWE